MPKEKIAQVSAATINRTRSVGRDEFGREILSKEPTMLSEWMMDRDGNVMAHALRCHRIDTLQSKESYGDKHRRRLIAEGNFPVRECPYTLRYEELVGGPLARPAAGEKACKGAKVVDVEPFSPEAEELGATRAIQHGSGKLQMVVPCKHYRALREKLMARNREEAETRKAAEQKDPTEAMIKMAKSFQKMADQGLELSATRGNLAAGRGELEEEKR